MRVFSILSVVMGLAFAGLAVYHQTEGGALQEVVVFGLVAVLSFASALQRLSHRLAFFVAAVLAVGTWVTHEPVVASFDDPIARGRIGLFAANVWMILMAFVAQRVSARRLYEG